MDLSLSIVILGVVTFGVLKGGKCQHNQVSKDTGWRQNSVAKYRPDNGLKASIKNSYLFSSLKNWI